MNSGSAGRGFRRRLELAWLLSWLPTGGSTKVPVDSPAADGFLDLQRDNRGLPAPAAVRWRLRGSRLAMDADVVYVTLVTEFVDTCDHHPGAARSGSK